MFICDIIKIWRRDHHHKCIHWDSQHRQSQPCTFPHLNQNITILVSRRSWDNVTFHITSNSIVTDYQLLEGIVFLNEICEIIRKLDRQCSHPIVNHPTANLLGVSPDDLSVVTRAGTKPSVYTGYLSFSLSLILLIMSYVKGLMFWLLKCVTSLYHIWTAWLCFSSMIATSSCSVEELM